MKRFGLIRVAAAMPRVHVADPAANAREIMDLCGKLSDQAPSVVVFPELSVTGYTCGDLFGQNRLLADAEQAVAWNNKVIYGVGDIETVFLMSAQEHLAVSSSLVRELLKCGKQKSLAERKNLLSKFVPKNIVRMLLIAYRKTYETL